MRVRRRTTLTTFKELGVLPETCAALEAVGITDAFAIQEMTLPVALTGQDVIGQAKTGTGKTLGFTVPMMQRLVAPQDPAYADLSAPGAPQALVVVPTRELAVQVAGEVRHTGRTRGIRVLTVYGGRSYEPQIEALEAGVEIVVGTPGRLLDLVEKSHLHLGDIGMLVLDEADEMLDMGFLPDVERIVALTPTTRQTMLFSATMPGDVVALARRYMHQPTHIRAVTPDDDNTHLVQTVEQHAFRAHPLDKPELMARILQAVGRGHTMVFCRTKRQAQKLADDLSERGFAVGAVHGDLGQGARERAMRAFRTGKVDVLVATDVAARGIDVEGITHVVNYSCPEDEKTYVHRIGRTGRAGASGVAITFVDWDDIPRWNLIAKTLGIALEEPRETYSTSDHLFEELGIPREVTGTLPRSQRTLAGLDAEEVEDLGETGKKQRRDSGSGSGSGSGSRSGSGSGSRSGAGSSSRGSRDRGRDSSGRDSSGRDSSGSREAAGAPASTRPPRSRNRRRTRGGSPVSEGGADASSAPGSSNGAAASSSSTDASGTASETRRRRRRRGGAGTTGDSSGAAGSSDATG
jgi:superfamily II DNA/RNA helicase